MDWAEVEVGIVALGMIAVHKSVHCDSDLPVR